MSATALLGAAQVNVDRLAPRLPAGQQPRVPVEHWSQTCLRRDAVIEHVMALPTGVRHPDAKRAYRLGLRHLLTGWPSSPAARGSSGGTTVALRTPAEAGAICPDGGWRSGANEPDTTTVSWPAP